MIQPKTLLPPDNQTRFKRSSGSNKCSLYPLQVDLSTLYERQYTVGGIVQIGNCQGDCSNEIHLLTFHARVRLLMKQRQSGRDSANLSPGHCGPEKYKSHKIMYIEPENEQMHIIMEIKDLVVDSCNCH
uniref:Gdf-like protein n=1 Tax=Schmidtea mediterranea TaxID=79327 RepID=U3RHZ4_SCHMD|nr:gdf-like protein [Schmidtea mediterranea]